MTNEKERLAQGKEIFSKIHSELGHKGLSAFSDIAPDFVRYVYEFAYGDIYGNSGLDLRSRQITTLAALTALGHAAPQLKVHIVAALNNGLTQKEIVQIIIQLAVYAGFPVAFNGLMVAKEAFAEYDQNKQ